MHNYLEAKRSEYIWGGGEMTQKDTQIIFNI